MDTTTKHTDERHIRRVDRRASEMGAGRPYRFALFPNPDGGFVLRSPDLPGRSADVASIDEVGSALRVAIQAPRSSGHDDEDDGGQYSGKFVLRLPRTLHRQLAELAIEEGVSLNQLALTFLAEGMGRTDAAHDFGERRGGARGGRKGHRGHGHGRSEHERRGPHRADLRGFDRGERAERGERFEGRGNSHWRARGVRHGEDGGFGRGGRRHRLNDTAGRREAPELI